MFIQQPQKSKTLVKLRAYVTGDITVSVRKVQNKLMKKVGDKVGCYPTLPNMTDEHS